MASQIISAKELAEFQALRCQGEEMHDICCDCWMHAMHDPKYVIAVMLMARHAVALERENATLKAKLAQRDELLRAFLEAANMAVELGRAGLLNGARELALSATTDALLDRTEAALQENKQ